MNPNCAMFSGVVAQTWPAAGHLLMFLTTVKPWFSGTYRSSPIMPMEPLMPLPGVPARCSVVIATTSTVMLRVSGSSGLLMRRMKPSRRPPM
jgi:hypothetical protein